MAEYLVIRIAAEAERPASWIPVDGNGTRLGAPATGTLEDAAAAADGREVIVLVPAGNVLTTTVDVPIRGGSRLLAALPFALEEQVADDVEALHFAPGPRHDNGRLPVAVVSHEQMREWLERLENAGIPAARMVPENYGLARIPGTLSVLAAEDQVMFNDGEDNEFLLQGVKPSDALAVAGVLDEPAGDGASPRHLVVYCEPADEDRFRHDWIALRHELAGVDIHLLPDGVLPRLAVTVAAGNGVDLLQGQYGRRTETGALLRPWRTAALLLVALGVVALGGKAVDTWRLSHEADTLKAQFTEEYREIRPGDTRDIVDPVATVNSVLRSYGTPAATTVFLPTLRELGAALQQNGDADIEAISYRAGVVDVRLTAPDVATLDNIQRQVGRSGRFRAAIQSTDQVGDRVSSRIQIREAGA